MGSPHSQTHWCGSSPNSQHDLRQDRLNYSDIRISDAFGDANNIRISIAHAACNLVVVEKGSTAVSGACFSRRNHPGRRVAYGYAGARRTTQAFCHDADGLGNVLGDVVRCAVLCCDGVGVSESDL